MLQVRAGGMEAWRRAAGLACRVMGCGRLGRTSWSRGPLNRAAGAQKSLYMCLGTGAWILIPVHVRAQSVLSVRMHAYGPRAGSRGVSWARCYQVPQGPS